jgi:hypothetical protein
MNLRNIAINISLAVTGVALWSYGANRLASEGDFDYRPNPLGLKMSPYGQVIALAVQGGIDSDWHGTEARTGDHACSACGHDHGTEESSCASAKKSAADDKSFIGKIEEAVAERTNPRPATHGHKFYLRRQVEDRLRFSSVRSIGRKNPRSTTMVLQGCSLQLSNPGGLTLTTASGRPD